MFIRNYLPKLLFNSDLIYKHKFTKSGFSGTHFSGGLSYHFFIFLNASFVKTIDTKHVFIVFFF